MNYKIKNRIEKATNIIINIPTYLIANVKYVFSKKNQNFVDDLSICAIAKNEGEYINEWIEHHINIGCSKIYLFDNDSDDDMYSKIQKYINAGIVVYEKISGKNRQYDAYNIAVKKYKNKTKYMGFIDCDEFLMPCSTSEKTIEILDELFAMYPQIGGLGVNWRMYGSSGHIKKPDDLVLVSYLYRANDENGIGNNCIKTIANPRKIYKFIHAHYPIYLCGFYNINENGKKCHRAYAYYGKLNKLRINHYFTKSKEEWIKRRSIGKADTKYTNENKRTIDEFYKHDNNDVYDDIGIYYGSLIKK